MSRESILLMRIAAKVKTSHKCIDEAEQLMKVTPLDVEELRAIHDALEGNIKDIRHLYQKLCNHYGSTGDHCNEVILQKAHDDEWENIRPLRRMVSAIANKVKLKNDQERPTSRGLLPSLKVEVFQGEVGKFQAFIDSFEASIDSRTDIRAADKLKLLKNYLKGPPLTLVESSFRATAENYSVAVQTLKDWYGNQLRYELTLVRGFLDLKAPAHNLKELNYYHAQYESIIRSLGNAGCDVKAHEYFFVRALKCRLNNETWSAMRTVSNMDKNDLEEFRMSFNKLLSDMEYGQVESRPQRDSQHNHDQEKARSSVDSGSTHQKQKKRWRKQDIGNCHISSKGERRSVYTQKSGGASSSLSTSSDQCILCNENHYMYKCTKYASVEERKRRASELRRCLKCFKPHASSDCTTNLQVCRNCHQGRHHALFCPGDSKDSTKNSNTKAAPVISTVESGGEEISNGAIPTARAVVGGVTNKADTRVFFDLGAQRTFIHSDLVHQLNLKPTGTAELTIDGFTGPWPKRRYDVVSLVVSIGDKSQTVNAVVIDRLPKGIYTEGLGNTIKYLRNKGLKMADATLTEDSVLRIGILMGTDYSMEYIKQFSLVDNIHLIETSGGYAVVGQLPPGIAQSHTSVSSIVVADVNVGYDPVLGSTMSSDVEKFIPQFWEL